MNIAALVFDVFRETWTITGEMAPYLLLGFLMAGILRFFIREETVVKHLGSRGFIQTLKATLIGVPMPLCSCGVIPVAASLRRRGAGKGATTAFLSSTPQTGVDSIMATYGLLGSAFAIVRVIVSFVSGLVTGVLVDRFDGNEPSEINGTAPADEEKDEKRGFRTIIKYGFVTLPHDIGKAVLLGLVVAGVLGVVIPASFFSDRLGNIYLEILVMTLIAIPLYVCSTGSIPVAMAFLKAGISPGAALVFLIAGPATNAATVTTLWKLLGRKTTAIYVGSIIGMAWLVGFGLKFLPFTLTDGTAIHGHEAHLSWFSHTSAIVLILILINAVLTKSIVTRKKRVSPRNDSLTSMTLQIQGMRCTHCAESVSRSLLASQGVVHATVDLQRGTADVSGTALDPDVITREVEALGYACATAGTE